MAVQHSTKSSAQIPTEVSRANVLLASFLLSLIAVRSFDIVITATLIQDATRAKMLGGVKTTAVNGVTTQVWGAASCGFRDGILSHSTSAAAAFCYYFEVLDGVSSTFSTAMCVLDAFLALAHGP